MYSIYSRAINLMVQKIRQAQEMGDIRSDIDPEAFVFQIFSILEGTYLLSTLYPNKEISSIGQGIFENDWKGIENNLIIN